MNQQIGEPSARKHLSNPTQLTYLGMMSGTSVDGVDAVLTNFANEGAFKVIATLFVPYPQDLKTAINTIAQRSNRPTSQGASLEETQLDARLAEFYAQVALQILANNGLQPKQIAAIANHGQTIRHEPNAQQPISIQLGDPRIIAQRTGIRTIARFRQADLAEGGQGAPLMPAFHSHYFSNASNRVILNIGGIANITRISATKNTPVVGFDTGPGNTLLDQWIFAQRGDNYDAQGQWAASGEIDAQVLDTLLSDPYFALAAPKSTGPDYFNLTWLAERVPQIHTLAPVNVQATLLELTAESIYRATMSHAPNTREVLVCGGGAHNAQMMHRLQDKFARNETTVGTTDSVGVPADWVEALGFAWLGYCFDAGIPSNLPSVTGARAKVVLGEQFNADEQ